MRRSSESSTEQIGFELAQITSQAILRGLDNPRAIFEALGNKTPEARALQKNLREGKSERELILQAMAEGISALPKVALHLHRMVTRSRAFYRVAAQSYSDVARSLPPPPEPLPAPPAGHQAFDPTAPAERAGETVRKTRSPSAKETKPLRTGKTPRRPARSKMRN